MKKLIYAFVALAMFVISCGNTKHKIIEKDAEGRPLDANKKPLQNVNWCNYYISNIVKGKIDGVDQGEGICIKCAQKGDKCPDYLSGTEITITDGTNEVVVRITSKGVMDTQRACGDCIFTTSQETGFSDFVEE